MDNPTTNIGPSECVTFNVGSQCFCVDIMSLREIRGWSQVAPLPDTPDYVLGVVNLRGTVLPIIDLAKRLNLEKSEAQDRSIITVSYTHLTLPTKRIV